MLIQFYGQDPLPMGRSLFLLGPNTDEAADGRRSLDSGLSMSAWRTRFVSGLIEELFLDSSRLADLTIIVPEFHEKEESPDWFANQAAATFGTYRGLLKWEEAHLAHAGLVVGWGSEIYGLMLRMHLRADCATWRPKRLILGMSSITSARSAPYLLLAEQLGFEIHEGMSALVKATAAILVAEAP